MAEFKEETYFSDEDLEVYNKPYMEGGNALEFQDGSREEETYFSDEDIDESFSEDTMESVAAEEGDSYFSDKDLGGSFEPVSSSTADLDNQTEAMLYTRPSKNTYNPKDVVTKDFFMSQNAQTSIGMFMKSRYGTSGIKQDDESKEEYAERFFNKMRWMQNNIASTGAGLSWLHGADELTKQNINPDFKKVDINILLNRVKVDNFKNKKKNIAFIFFILLGLISSAYLIF